MNNKSDQDNDSGLSINWRDRNIPAFRKGIERGNIFEPPVYRKPPFWSRRWFKFILLVLLLAALACMGLYFVEFKNADELKAWNMASRCLDSLKSGSMQSLQSLRNIAGKLPESKAKTGILTVYALGSFKTGDIKTGKMAANFLNTRYPDSSFSKFTMYSNIAVQCSQCNGAGLNEMKKCSECDGSEKCRVCGGTGKRAIQRYQLARSNWKKQGKKMRVKRLGVTYSSDESFRRCPYCRGNGKCHVCTSSFYVLPKCDKCAGNGWIYRSARINTAYNDALKITQRYVFLKKKQGQLKGFLVQVQSRLRGRCDSLEDAFDFEAEDMDISNEPDDISVSTLSNDNTDESTVTDSGQQDDAVETSRFDGLIKLSYFNGIELAVDAECISGLSAKTFDADKLSALTGKKDISAYLQTIGYLGKDTMLGEKRVFFVTRPEIWMYSAACFYLDKGEMDKARRIFSRQKESDAMFANHCKRLSKALKAVEKQSKLLDVACNDVKKRVTLATGVTGDMPVHVERNARDSLFRYRAVIQKTAPLLLDSAKKAYEAKLISEAVCLSEIIKYHLAILLRYVEKAESSSVRLGENFPGNLPLVNDLSVKLRLANERFIALVDAAEKELAEEDLISAYQKYSDAMAEDRSKFNARVGLAYSMTKRHQNSVKLLLMEPSPVDAKRVEIAVLLKQRKKRTLMGILQTIGQEDIVSSPKASKVPGVAGYEKIEPPLLEGIARAARAKGIELITISPLFEEAIQAASVEDLCMVTVLMTDSLPVNMGGDAPEVPLQAITATRKGQIQFMLGMKKEARKTLKPIAERFPEMYTARRLLELMEIHTP